MDGKDYVRLTEKGCEWNKFESIRDSEKNPSVGNQSEQTRKKIRESVVVGVTSKEIEEGVWRVIQPYRIIGV